MYMYGRWGTSLSREMMRSYRSNGACTCSYIYKTMICSSNYSPSPIISISILGLRSQYACFRAKSEVSPKHMLIC